MSSSLTLGMEPTFKKKEIKKAIPLMVASKGIKYLGISLTKEEKNIYTGKYKKNYERNLKRHK